MRVLFTIPHYYRGVSDDARHGSESTGGREGRRIALDNAISQIHNLFGSRRFAAQHQRKAMTPAPNLLAFDFDIAVCTTQGAHLLDELSCPPSMYHHVRTNADPKFLGWECHRLLEENLGKYDFYCYLEDDIILHDPFFFAKLKLFNDYFSELDGQPALLQPQRYETAFTSDPGRQPILERVYMDYQALDAATYEGEPLEIEHLGINFTLEPTSLPHAGCFFLSEDQMRVFAAHPLFLRKDKIWVTPLDTAATLVIALAFRVYKPALDSMAFLEVCHGYPAMIQQISAAPSGELSWAC
jgi:hypothetical protein